MAESSTDMTGGKTLLMDVSRRCIHHRGKGGRAGERDNTGIKKGETVYRENGGTGNEIGRNSKRNQTE